MKKREMKERDKKAERKKDRVKNVERDEKARKKNDRE